MDQRGGLQATSTLGIQPLVAVETGQVQHLLRRLIQGGQLLRQGPCIARNQRADLLALLTQGLGQRFSSALPGLGQQRPALWRCLAPRAHRARRFIGQ
ncbi:hypothetical protein D3C78_1118650 [compost metagenome]